MLCSGPGPTQETFAASKAKAVLYRLQPAGRQRDDFLRLNEALDELTAMDPRSGQIVEMRYFGGMSHSEVAAALEVSLSTVKRDWETVSL